MTIKDIARLSGVSVSTVSRVLNNHPDVSAETTAKVRAVVDEQCFVPNNSARGLSKASSDNVGVIVRGISNPFYTGVIRELEKYIADAGYTMVMQQIGTREDELRAGAVMEREKRLLGVILLGGRSDYTAAEIACITVPHVFCSFDNSYGTLDKSTYSSVSIDDRATGREAVKKLHANGHRRIAMMLSGKTDSSVSQLRYCGYVEALKELGLELDDNLIIEAGSYDLADGYRSMKTWLGRGFDFTALFSVADNLAIGAMRAMRECGLEVPKDCSVISIDGLEVAEYMNPSISTYSQTTEMLGRKTVEILVDMIQGRGGNRQEVLPTVFRQGESMIPMT